MIYFICLLFINFASLVVLCLLICKVLLTVMCEHSLANVSLFS